MARMNEQKKLHHKVVHITSVHPPYDTRIFHRECKSLLKICENVVLIAPHDQDEVVDGIAVRAVPQPCNRIQRMVKTSWFVLRRAIRERSVVYHFHDPELIPVGILLKLCGKRVIYDVHEDVEADILDKYWIPRALRKPISKLFTIFELITSHFFDAIIAATPKIAERFPRGKTYVVQNFPRKDEMIKLSRPYGKRPNKIVYVGSITLIRGIREMVQAISLIPDLYAAELVLVGPFSPAELHKEIANCEGWDRVSYLGWQPRDKIKDLLNDSRVGLALFHPAANHLDAQPNKLFEYMNAGLPVIVSNFPAWNELMEKTRCGITVDPLDPMEIARAIQWMLDNAEEASDMGKRGQEWTVSRFNWEHESSVLYAVYKKLLS